MLLPDGTRRVSNKASTDAIRLHVPKLAVQGRYNQNPFLSISSCFLQGIAERPLPCNYNVIQFVCALSRRYTGSNPVGDARSISYGENFYSLFKEMPGNHGFREYSATSRIHSATCHLQSAVETPCESLISKDKPGRSQELGSDSLSMNTGLSAVHRAIVEGLMCVEH
jgi:hypothetical protein